MTRPHQAEFMGLPSANANPSSTLQVEEILNTEDPILAYTEEDLDNVSESSTPDDSTVSTSNTAESDPDHQIAEPNPSQYFTFGRDPLPADEIVDYSVHPRDTEREFFKHLDYAGIHAFSNWKINTQNIGTPVGQACFLILKEAFPRGNYAL